MTGAQAEPGHHHGPHCTDGLTARGQRAWERGLYRDAAQMFKTAAGHGDAEAAGLLILHLHASHPGDDRTARWGVAHAALHSPAAVSSLLLNLHQAGAGEQLAALLDRDPAAQVALDGLDGVWELLENLNYMLRERPDCERQVRDQIRTLARRTASQMPLHDAAAVALLLDALHEVDAAGDVTELLARDPVAQVVLDVPSGIPELMESLTTVEAHQQAAALAERVMLHVASMSLENPREIASLLADLAEAQADEPRAVLLARNPAAQVSLEDPAAVATLLLKLVSLGERDQAGVLAKRAVAAFSLRDPGLVALLLDNLRGPGLAEHLRVVLTRDPAAQVSLQEPAVAVAKLLASLRTLAADDQIAALLARDPATCVSLDDPEGVLFFVQVLRDENAQQQIDTLLERLPDPEQFSLLHIADQQEIPRFGRRRNGTEAEPWGWDDLA